MDEIMDVLDYDAVGVDSDCVCVAYDEFDQPYPSDECYDCYAESLQMLEEMILLPWLKAHDADNGDYIVVRGSNVGWMRVSGESTLELDYDSVLDDLMSWFGLNGDFNLSFKLDKDQVLTVRRGSHDEPMGANFDLRIVKSDRV